MTVVLAEAVDSLQKCLEVLTDPCVVFDPVRDAEGEVIDLRCVFVNAAAEELCQRRAAQVVGRTVLSLYPSVTGSGVLACSTEPFRTGRPSELHVSAIDDGAIDGTFDVVAGLFGDHVLVTAHSTLMQASDRPTADDPGEFVFLSDSAGRIEWVSPSVRAVVGWSPSELVGREAREFMPRADAHLPGAEELLADGPAPGPRRHRFLTRNGAYRWLTTTDHEIRDSRGAVTATVSGVRDAQAEVEPEQAQAQAEVEPEQAQAAAETRFRLIAENASDAVVVTGEGGRIEWVSPGVETVLGWDQAALIGLHLIDLLSPDDPHRAGHHRKRPFERVVAEPVLGRFRTASGGSRWMSGSSRPIAGAGGDVTGSVIGLRDVDIDVQSNAALRESETLFRTAMNSAAIGMAIYDTDFRFRVVNPAFCELVQRDEAWLLTHQCRDVMHPDDEIGAWREFTRLASGDDASCISHLRLVRADGSIRKVRVAVVLIRDSDGAPDYALGQIEDITAETNARDALAYQAFHDSLTGLRNRPRIMELLDTDLHAAGRNRGQVGVLFIDLDNFKVVNDSLGHVAGDEVLTIIAGRISAAVRPGDRVGRFGGDEFVVVTPGIEEPGELEAIASRISAAIATELNVQGHRLVPTASVGIAISGPGSTSTSLMRDADSALFRAKATGRSRWQFFEVGMHAQANRRLTTEDELRRALARHEIVVHYQPIAALADGSLAGYEALVRWSHPEKGLLAPDAFLPTAEESGLIVEVDAQVLEQVCRMISGRPGLKGRISVNMSPVEISRPDWRHRITSTLRTHGVHPRRINIEVTETAIMTALADSRDDLIALRALGFGIHMDDFGTGYSSIALLRDLPVTGLKLDTSFTRNITTDSTARILASGLAGLAEGLNLESIAEGIETKAQADLLRKQGWVHGQGYLFGRPQPEPATQIAYP